MLTFEELCQRAELVSSSRLSTLLANSIKEGYIERFKKEPTHELTRKGHKRVFYHICWHSGFGQIIPYPVFVKADANEDEQNTLSVLNKLVCWEDDRLDTQALTDTLHTIANGVASIQEKLGIEANAEASSVEVGRFALPSSDNSSGDGRRAWLPSSDDEPPLPLHISPPNVSDIVISMEPSRQPTTMHEKLQAMMSKRMYSAVCFLRMPEKSWWVVLYFAVALLVVALLRFALPGFGGKRGNGDVAFVYFANFGPTLFSYGYTWSTFSSAVDVWYSLYSVLSEERRVSCRNKWERRCKMGIVGGMLASLVGTVVNAIRIILHHPHMVSNVPVFCVLSGLMWLLNIVQTCLVSYGITAFLFTCSLSKYDIAESRITLRSFPSFWARCAKMHKFRMVTFISFFMTICFSVAFIWHAFLESFTVKFFIFIPFGVIFPHLSKPASGLGDLVWTLGLTIPYIVMFLRLLYATLWAAKAKAQRQVQLSGDLKDKFIASDKVSGWFLFYNLVRCFGLPPCFVLVVTRNAGCKQCRKILLVRHGVGYSVYSCHDLANLLLLPPTSVTVLACGCGYALLILFLHLD